MTGSWRCGAREWRYEPLRPLLMAIINVTPDSFSDGGRHADPIAAAAWAHECISAGAVMLDVGGESTKPGSLRVAPEVQVSRVVPAIQRMMEIPEVASGGVSISVDTTSAGVARAALDAGATIVNDVSAGEEDPELLALVAARGCGLVLMHRLRPPPEDSFSDRYAQPPEYTDVVATVAASLVRRVRRARDAGVDGAAIAVDPGLGFGKTVDQNVELMSRIGEIVALGHPVLVSASRKSFLGAICTEPDPSRRDAASAAAALAMSRCGVAVVRAHNIEAHRVSLRAAERDCGALGLLESIVRTHH